MSQGTKNTKDTGTRAFLVIDGTTGDLIPVKASSGRKAEQIAGSVTRQSRK
ncbi:MAG: hypothetical protein ABIJ92_04365 [Candidatus Aenigmatarchaeota archaeon]